MSLFGGLKFNPFQGKKRKIPDGLFSKCPKCETTLYNKEVEDQLKTCPKCSHHFAITAEERLHQLIDSGTFEEHDKNLKTADPLEFKGAKTYLDKIEEDRKKTGLNEAIISGVGQLNKIKVSVAVTDYRFIMGSMGSVVGEKLTRSIERAIINRTPVIIVSGSGGGARMYEGCFSLMQMAKTSGALSMLAENKLPFISVLTNPTMGGVLASFASLGDIILAEPGALIGFAGPRVVEQTTKQELPDGFQTSEYLLKHGMVDRVVHRKEMKEEIGLLLKYFGF